MIRSKSSFRAIRGAGRIAPGSSPDSRRLVPHPVRWRPALHGRASTASTVKRRTAMPGPKQLKEYRVRIEPVPNDQRAVALDYPDNLGLRTKLGGGPDWIQDDETPQCYSCGSEATFIAQIDSVEHSSKYNPLRRGRKEGQ